MCCSEHQFSILHLTLRIRSPRMLLLLVYRHRVVKSVVYHHRGRMVKEHDMIINIFHGFTEGCRVMQVSGSQPIWGASHSPAVLHCLYQPIALLGPTGGPDLGLCVEPVLRTSGGVRYISGCQARRRRDLGAAVGERGRYGVPVGGVVAVGGGRACAGHPHGLGLAAGTGWQGPYIQLVLQSCRDRKWARSRFASGVGRLYVRPVPLDRAEGVGIAKFDLVEINNLSST